MFTRPSDMDNDQYQRTLHAEIAGLRAERDRLVTALDQSLRLQSHYATLLNAYDGGERRRFCSVEEWLRVLAECQALVAAETAVDGGEAEDDCVPD